MSAAIDLITPPGSPTGAAGGGDDPIDLCTSDEEEAPALPAGKRKKVQASGDDVTDVLRGEKAGAQRSNGERDLFDEGYSARGEGDAGSRPVADALQAARQRFRHAPA